MHPCNQQVNNCNWWTCSIL